MSTTGEARVLRAGVRLRGGRYLLVAPLGRGGFASVWRARDTRTRQEVALKLLPAEDGGREAAEREAEVTARVRHPNVVRVLDTFCEEGWAGIVMELAVGSLADLVAEQGPLPPEAALAAVLQACAGLAEAHAAGVVHRDVKPHNLLLFPDGTVKVGDFGAARTVGHTRTRTANVLGSIPFMAPEQRRDPRAVRPATDVYALAVTTAWLVTGHAPGDLFAPGTLGELVEAGVPVGLAEALARAGAYDVRERPPDAGALGEVLRSAGVRPDDGGLRAFAARGTGEQPRSDPPFGEDALPALAKLGPDGPSRGGGPRNAHSAWSRRSAGLIGGLSFVALAWWGATRTFSPDKTTILAKPPPCGHPMPRDFTQHQVPGPREVVAAAFDDLDGDGFDDALFTSQLDTRVLIYRGNATPSLANPIIVPTRRSGSQAHAADVDGDGTKELLLSHRDEASWAAYRWEGDAAGALVGTWTQSPMSPQAWDVVHLTSGRDAIVFPATRDGCIYTRAFSNGELGPAQCAWRSMQHEIIRLHSAAGPEAVASFAGGGSVVLALKDDVSAVPVGRVEDGLTWLFDGRLIRLMRSGMTAWALDSASHTTPCQGPALTAAPSDIGDWNGDALADLIYTETCAYCTSSLSVLVGLPK